MDTNEIRNYLLSKSWTGKIPCGNQSIPAEMHIWIQEHYTPVDENDDAGRVWHKVYGNGTDCKYSAYMICLETEQRRPTNFLEFYGSAPVD